MAEKSNLFRTFFFVLEIARFDVNTVGPLNTIGERKYLSKRPFGCNNAKQKIDIFDQKILIVIAVNGLCL